MTITELIKKLEYLAKEGYADSNVCTLTNSIYSTVEYVQPNKYGDIIIITN